MKNTKNVPKNNLQKTALSNEKKYFYYFSSVLFGSKAKLYPLLIFKSIILIFFLGTHLISRRTGLIAGWLLITTFYFIFWARTASSDMLNLAGTMLAIVWYFSHKKNPSLKNYFVFL